jgi:hypothetical protein
MIKPDKNTSRRDFLRNLGIASVAMWSSRLGFAGPKLTGSDPLELLIIGDSVIWGQGLEEKDKFYTLTADWLRNSAPGAPREVRMKVKAHSGSSIKFHEAEAAAYKKAGRDETYFYKPEINIGFPSIWKQIEVADAEYRSAGNMDGAGVIMLTGGLTDISVQKLLDPFGDVKLLSPMIERYCRGDMTDLLKHANEKNPKALIVVVGYYPILSPKTDSGKLYNGWLESMSFPRYLKSVANNPLTRPLLFRGIRKKTIERSRIWSAESARQLRSAVDDFNAAAKSGRAIFVPSPITEDTCLETPDTLLFRMGKMGRAVDPLFHERQAECRSALPELKRSTGISYPVRYCEIASVGHPNPAGARAYAEAIKTALTPHFQTPAV